MDVLEIETINKLKKVENPRKARIVDRIFFDMLQIMDGDGDWHTISSCNMGVMAGKAIVENINSAIRNKKTHIYVNI